MRSMVLRAWRGGRAVLALGFALLLVACGGGEQRDPFVPQRLFAFGDEMSVLTNTAPLGRKYSVNGLDAGGQISCALNASNAVTLLWTQQLALYYRFNFAECNPLGLSVNAWTYAVPGAKAADFAAQYAAAVAQHGPLGPSDLVTLLVGANDVLELLPQYLADPTPARAQAIQDELRARGRRLAHELNTIMLGCGPKFVISTLLPVGFTPYVQQLSAARPADQITTWVNNFSAAFNSGLRAGNAGDPNDGLINDGRFWALVDLNSIVTAGINDPAAYALSNITQAACDPTKATMPDCSTATLVSGADPNTWLWASELWIGWRAHWYLGENARGRAADNPFGNSCPST